MFKYPPILEMIGRSRFCRAMVTVAMFLLPGLAGAENYYVDFAVGNDANDGTSKLTPFQTIPGTYKTDGTNRLRTSWGAISSSASGRVPDNTTFNIKCGTTHSSTHGGFVWLAETSTGFYNKGYTNLVIQADPTWGTGTTATLDGMGMTIGVALVICQVDGVTFRGLVLNNSERCGIQAKEKAGTGAALTNLVFDGLTFSNNGTIYLTDTAGAGAGQLSIRKANNIIVTNCVFDGDQNFINGIIMGETHKSVVGGLITGCTATNHRGDLVTDDSGIGFKAFNSQLTFTSCVSSGNLKGFDLGEQSGYDAGPDGTPADILYKVINCTARSNHWGINFNGVGANYAGAINFYAINNLIILNGKNGMNVYAAPHNAYIVHNLFENNGLFATGATPLYNNSHLNTNPNTDYDSGTINVHLFNNVFRGQLVGSGTTNSVVVSNKYCSTTNNYTLNSDYNSYLRSGANTYFCYWSVYSAPKNKTYYFGTDGPGKASGNWYSQYSNDATPPPLGLGHYHSDAHSKGTGCTDTNQPPLNASYMPTNSYAGLNLATQPWYIPEMGVDRSGMVRIGWDIGAYEYPRQSRLAPPWELRRVSQDEAFGFIP